MINNNKKYKIAMIGDCLSGGGAEKVHSLLSVYFDKNGLAVHNCIFVDWVTYKYSGSLLNLGKISPNSFFVYRKIKRFFIFRRFIKSNNFDFVIDFRMRTDSNLEFLIRYFIYPKNAIYRVASGILEFYFPKSKIISNAIYKNSNIIAVSDAIKTEIINRKLATKVNYIYNPVDFDSIDSLKDEFSIDVGNYILAIGGLKEVKQFDKLIEAYSKSILPKKNIKLIILGEGEEKTKCQKIIQKLELENLVEFKDFIENPYPYYKKALFTVLCSKNEGFPNVLLESLACETPVVSFDCFSGPNEIIQNSMNGILVENQNFEELIKAMNTLFLDENLYLHCKQNAKQSAGKFAVEKIGIQWLELFKDLSK